MCMVCNNLRDAPYHRGGAGRVCLEITARPEKSRAMIKSCPICSRFGGSSGQSVALACQKSKVVSMHFERLKKRKKQKKKDVHLQLFSCIQAALD